MLWVDKYRPKDLDDLDHHPILTQRLRMLASGTSGEMLPHLLFYGPSGAGKKTRVYSLLRTLFGPNVERMKLERKAFKNGSKVIEITALASNFHVEINPSDIGNQDRLVVQEMIKEMAQTVRLDLTGGGGGSSSSSSFFGTNASSSSSNKNKSTSPSSANFKVIVITEADRLSKAAQHALRRTMEKNVSACRLILICESLSKIIDPLRSRCSAIRVPAPSIDEICTCLTKVVSCEGLEIPSEFAVRVAHHSNRNLRRAILTLEACRVQQYPFTKDQTIQVPDWERYIFQLAQNILKTQSPQAVTDARGMVYELLANCIPPSVILKTLSSELCKRLDDELKHKVVHWAAFYEYQMRLGQKPVYYIEAFIAKFMSLYKRYLMEMFA